MAKISTLNHVRAASVGAVMIVRDMLVAPGDDDQPPPLCGVDGSSCTLTLLGLDSPEAKKIDYRVKAGFQNRILARATGGKHKTIVVTPDDVAQQVEDELELLVALTLNWSGFEDDADQPLPFSKPNVRMLYEGAPTIRLQAAEFIGNRASFLGS